MFSTTSNLNINGTTLDAGIDKKYLSYIAKLRLSPSITQRIYSCLILNNIHIVNLIIALDIKLNLWVLNCLKSYQLSPGLIIHKILEVFC